MRVKNILSVASIILLIMFFSFTPAQSEITFSVYDKVKNDKDFEYYITGVGVGYVYANVELQLNNRPKLYCQPNSLSLGPDNYRSILDEEIKFQSKMRDIPAIVSLETLLLRGLIRTFPCK
jgi:hypothetical protein